MSCCVCYRQIGDTYVSIASLKMHMLCHENMTRCIMCDRKCFDKRNNACLLCGSITITKNAVAYDSSKCPKCGTKLITRTETRYYEITAHEYEVDCTVCPTCNPING